MGRFGEFLVREGKLRPEQLKKVMEMQQLAGGRLGTNVLELGFLREETLLEALGQFRRSRTATASDLRNVPAEIFKLVPSKIARRHLVVPIERRGHTLVLASNDPGDPLVEDELGHLTACLVRTVVALEVRVHEALERYYQLPQPTRLSGLARRLDRPKEERPSREAAAGGARASSPKPEAPARPAPPRPRPRVPARSAAQSPRADRPERDEAEIKYIDLDADTKARIYTVSPEKRTPQARLDVAAEMLETISIRDEIGDVIFDYSKPYLKRRLLLIRRKDQIIGWRGEGEGVEREKVRAIDIPAAESSVFLTILQGTDFWLGSLAPLPAHRSLMDTLGEPPPQDCLVIPIVLRSRVVCFFYGDGGGESVSGAPLAELRRLATKAGVAFEVCILKNKIRTL